MADTVIFKLKEEESRSGGFHVMRGNRDYGVFRSLATFMPELVQDKTPLDTLIDFRWDDTPVWKDRTLRDWLLETSQARGVPKAERQSEIEALSQEEEKRKQMGTW